MPEKFADERLEPEIRKPKRESGISRIVGFNPEEEKEISQHLRGEFENQSDKEIFKGVLLRALEQDKGIN